MLHNYTLNCPLAQHYQQCKRGKYTLYGDRSCIEPSFGYIALATSKTRTVSIIRLSRRLVAAERLTLQWRPRSRRLWSHCRSFAIKDMFLLLCNLYSSVFGVLVCIELVKRLERHSCIHANIFKRPRLNVLGGPLSYSASSFKI